MKICYVAPDIPVPHTGDFIGGSTHTLEVAKGLVDEGDTVYIISRRMQGQQFFEKISEGVYTYRIYRGLIFPVKGGSGKTGKAGKKKIIEELYFKTVYRFFVILLVLFVSWKHNIDGILERNSAKGAGVYAGKILGSPAVVEVIDPDSSNYSLRLSRKIFAYTKKTIPPDVHYKTEMTHAGVDTGTFKPVDPGKVKKAYNLTGNVVVYVGSLSQWHGAEFLIDIAEIMKDTDVTFLMVGKDVKSLEEEAKKKNIRDRFIFPGFVEYKDIPAYVSAADVAIAPYNPAGFREMKKYGFYFSPIKIFEYMACGKPVVASDVDIVRDIIKENECGLLAQPGDVRGMSYKINEILDNPGLKRKLGDNGRKAALEKFSWKQVAEAFHRELSRN